MDEKTIAVIGLSVIAVLLLIGYYYFKLTLWRKKK